MTQVGTDGIHPDLGRALKRGAIGGIIAGLIFPMFGWPWQPHGASGS